MRITRREAVGAVAVGLAGCSRFSGSVEDGDEPDNPALASAEGDGALRVTSPAFADGEAIPDRYGRGAENVNPPLEVDGIPDDTESLAVVVDDPDAVEVAGEIFVHWLVWNLSPDRTSIPEDWAPETAVEGENDFGGVGYGGPAPPDEPHTYRFKCFALAGTLSLPGGATAAELGAAMAGEIAARAQLTGTYAP